MADLLALADTETSEAVARPPAGLHGVARPPAPAPPRSRLLYETISEDEVLVFSGAEEAIFVLANVLLGPGDHAIVAWPSYQSLHEVARAAGRGRDAPRAPRERRLGDRRRAAARAADAARRG